MKYLWQTQLDRWIPESQDVSNMTSRGISYQYMPPITDMYAGNEAEEEKFKINIPGTGRISINNLKQKIIEHLKRCEELVVSDSIKDLEMLEHAFLDPKLSGMIKLLVNHVKTLKSNVH